MENNGIFETENNFENENYQLEVIYCNPSTLRIINSALNPQKATYFHLFDLTKTTKTLIM